MTATAHYPTSWLLLQETLSDGRRDETLQNAFDFQARWRFAKSFTGMKVEGYKTPDIVNGYHALLKMVITCTAREQLAKVVGEDKYALCCEDLELSSEIRSTLGSGSGHRFAEYLRRESGVTQHKYLDRFWDGATSDLSVLAFAIRNGVAHGSLTPTGSGINSPRAIGLILELAEVFLRDSDERFTKWVELQVARSSVSP